MRFFYFFLFLLSLSFFILKIYDPPSYVNSQIKTFLFVLPEFSCILIFGFRILSQKKFLNFLSILAFYSFLILYTLDISLLLFFANNSEDKLKKNLYENKIEYDFRTKKQVLFDQRQKNINSQISVSPANWLNKNDSLFPLSSVSNVSTVYCNENGNWIVYNSDRFGFRNNDNKWDNYNDYILLGDSFTQGGCVNNNENISGLLDVNKISNINLGWGGTSILIQNAILREYIDHIDSNNVILFFYPKNDLLEYRTEIKDSRLLNYFQNLNYKQGLTSKQNLVNIYIHNYIENWIRSEAKSTFYKPYQIKKLFSITLTILKQYLETDVKNDYFNKLNIFNEWLNKKEINLTVVCVPSYSDFENMNTDTSCSKYKKNFNYINIKYVDVFDQMKDHSLSKLYPFGLNMHFSPYGYKVFVDSFLAYL